MTCYIVDSKVNKHLPEHPDAATRLLEHCWAELQELKKGELKLYPAFDPYAKEDDGGPEDAERQQGIRDE